MIPNMIWVTFDVIGFHAYSDAPNEVAYLRDRHRHKFMYKVWIEIQHNDREIEFHLFKTWLYSLYQGCAIEANNKSCEMLIDDLANEINKKYPKRYFIIEVSEDGECGAIKHFPC